MAEHHVTHGCNRKGKITFEYRSWQHMKNRCYNTKDALYQRWGGKGITVCERWKDSFENFLSDMGLKPSQEYSLDRNDNSLGYYPDNCRWATATEQSRNRNFKNKSSQFPGVCWSKQKNKWRAVVKVKGIQKHIGFFLIEKEAYDAYLLFIGNYSDY
jgi:hypothetical protein